MKATTLAVLLAAAPCSPAQVSPAHAPAPAETAKWFAEPPLGLDAYMPTPESTPITKTRAELGKKLFFDTRLSRDGTVSCATCHDPQRAFSDGRTVARGVDGIEGVRNAPAIINRGYGKSFFWDGRAGTLEIQALEPILNQKEMALTEPDIERKTGLKTAEVTAALASFVRTIRSGDSPYDRYTLGQAGGQASALTDLEKAGLELFRGKGRCGDCHVGPNFTDEQYHNTGVAWQPKSSDSQASGQFTDQGRIAVTGQERDRGAFKTPTLRDVAPHRPYMHDGSLATLEDVIEFYSQGGRVNPNLDHDIRPRRFTPEEQRALAAFLRSLTGKLQY